MAVPHQVELFVVTPKDRRPNNEDVRYATTTPHAYLSHAKKIGRAMMNNDEQQLYVFRVQIPMDVDVIAPSKLQDDIDYAELLTLHEITEPNRIKFIRCGKWRFLNQPTVVEVDSGTTITLYPEGRRLS